MQIKTFTIPIISGDSLSEEMNVFLRSKKILKINEQLINHVSEGVFWCYSIRYVDDIAATEREKVKVDYRKVLDEASFNRFSALRKIRKKVAEDDDVPPYVVLTDSEMAELAREETITSETIKNVKGIGEKKLEKYGHFFLTQPQDEKSR
jgi:superfamily II DNA helicase RecQ